MAERDDHDPDREAIMARRRRFIAVALGGLAGCTPGKPGPTPTTTTTTTGTTTGGESSESGHEGGTESGTDTAPQPCLKYDLPPSSESESDSGTETGTPRPCLTPPGLH